MTVVRQNPRESHVLALARTPREAATFRAVLSKASLEFTTTVTVEDLARELEQGAGALILSDKALSEAVLDQLVGLLSQQPSWSSLPVLVVGARAAGGMPAAIFDVLGNATLIEKPVRSGTLISAVRAALRARQRQYEIRSYLREQQEAAATRHLLAAIVESSDDAIVSKTLDGTITSWNSGAERLFGYSAAEAVGRPITLIIPVELQDEEREILGKLSRGERIDHYETVRMAKSGTRIDVSLTVSPLRDATGRVVGASKVARDITLRKRTEAALKEADQRKDEFLATLAHELRNPLAPIRNSLHILRFKDSLDSQTQGVLDVLERQVNHMVRLVDDLLELSRITRGKIELRKERSQLTDVIRSAVETSKPLIDAAGHRLIVTLPAEPVILDVDPVRISQVFSNLLNNAAKYSPEPGSIWIAARFDGADVEVAVRDTGMGIEPSILPHVFEMFMQGDGSHSTQSGLGIGLTLVRSLVLMHGGSVEAKSEGRGKGSLFIVRLPLAIHATAAGPAPEATRLETKPLAPHRIFVVDDNRDAADSLATLLRHLGAEVRVAYDGAGTLAMLDSADPEVLLLDIGMPGMDGYEVARRIRSEPRFKDVRLIALTGWGQEEDQQRCYAAGFDHHLIKPVDVENLQSLILSL